MVPPTFLNRKCDIRPMLMSIEVNISAAKTGRIAIKEGDDLNFLARNFCKVYNLDKEMEKTLLS
jgi:hypothetical protein